MDPTLGEFNPARQAFEDREYQLAQRLLEELRRSYPNSATVLARFGDAVLFEHKSDSPEYRAAAERALEHYRAAQRLSEAGCELPPRAAYYLHMGLAYAHLRLDDSKRAREVLRRAATRWSDSAEAHYNLARAHCIEEDVDACLAALERCLVLAKELRRPRFLRTHRSVDEWIRRSRTQSEFPPLRRDPRYERLVGRFTP